MGDFCLSGFHSRVPIKNGDKVIAIICDKRKSLDEIDYCPCYVQSPLIPLHIPIVGEMGDYGILDSVVTDVTTAFLEKKLGMDFIEVSRRIQNYRMRSVDWNERQGVTNLFNALNAIPAPFYRSKIGPTFTIIYEHYAIYKAMTHDNETLRETFKQIPLKGNIFDTNIIYNMAREAFFNKAPKEELEKIDKLVGILTPGEYLSNYKRALPGLNYFYTDCDIDWSNSLDSVIDWCSFISSLEYMNGEFTYSMHAGQTWWFDEDYVREHQHLHQLMTCLYERFLPEDFYD